MNYLLKMISESFENADCTVYLSKTVTQEEWEKVYEEILTLSDALDLAYVEDFDIDGVKGKCLARAKEINEVIWQEERLVWKAEGLYNGRKSITPLHLCRKLKPENCGKDEGSAFLGYAYKDESLAFQVMGGELQDINYITSILGIAFLIEARLPDKAFVHGNFFPEFAEKALLKINKLLKEPIELPVVCRPEVLIKYVMQANGTKEAKFSFFKNTYLYLETEEYWKALEENFSEDFIGDYIKKNRDEKIKTIEENRKQKKDKKYDKEKREYDIEWAEELFDYKNGMTINPDLLRQIVGAFDTFEAARKQDGYKYFSQFEPIEQLRRLAKQPKYFPIKDVDWIHCIEYFKTHDDGLERYYPLFMTRYEDYSPTCHMVRSFFINDELYEYCKDLYYKK